MRITNVTEQVLTEQMIAERFVKDIEHYVIEANLTADQINDIFTAAETGQTNAGNNRTAIGKGKDAADFINNKMKELTKAVANSGPVQNMDQKFEELKTKITAENPKVAGAIQQVSDWAKANPGKASIAVMILTTAAGMVGGPLGGAIGGFLARATKDLLKGDKLSTAVGKSAKTAMIGALIGMASDYIAKDEIEAIATAGNDEIADIKAAMSDANFGDAVDNMPPDLKAAWEANPNLDLYDTTYRQSITFGTGYGASYDGVLMPDQKDMLYSLSKTMDAAWDVDPFSVETRQAAIKYVEYLRSLKDTNATLNDVSGWLAGAKDLTPAQLEIVRTHEGSLKSLVDNLKAASDAGSAAAQGVATGALGNKKKPQESFVPGKKLSEGQIYLLFKRLATVNQQWLDEGIIFESVFDAVRKQQINEEDWLDTIKKTVGGTISNIKTARDIAPDWDAAIKSKDPAQIEKGISNMADKMGIDKNDPGYKNWAGSQRYKAYKAADIMHDVTSAAEKKVAPMSTIEVPGVKDDEWVKFGEHSIEEGPMDAIKKGVGAVKGAVKGAAGFVGDKLKTAGKNLTTKVTADKLKKAWKKAGSPTDSNAVAAILAQAGVNAEVVNTVYKDMGIEAPKAVPSKQPASDAQGASDTGSPQGSEVASSGINIQDLADTIKRKGYTAQVKAYLGAA